MPHDVSLVTQMRAGTHYMCAALRFSLEAQVMRPRDGAFAPMDDADIIKDMHPSGRFELPPPRPGRHIYFSHYYHPQFRSLPPMSRLSLIGFPLDSFYSDGVVYSDTSYSAGPSGLRAHAGTFVFRYGSEEWKILEERMHQNAHWLSEAAGGSAEELVVRYEDLDQDFERTSAAISAHLTLLNPLPRPVINRKRSYWTQDYEAKFDDKALAVLIDIFAPAISRFYPERLAPLQGLRLPMSLTSRLKKACLGLRPWNGCGISAMTAMFFWRPSAKAWCGAGWRANGLPRPTSPDTVPA